MANERGTTERWIPLAERFPSTLVKDTAPELLEDGETPDAYGLGIDLIGSLYSGSLPTGTARPTYTVGTDPTDHTSHQLTVANYDWYYIHNRLWAVGDSTHRGTAIYYFAPGYDTKCYAQGLGELTADDNIIGLIPLGTANILAIGTASSVIIPNANSWRGNFVLGTVLKGFGAAGMNDVTEHGGVVYATNSNGVYACDGQNIRELTADISQTLGNFTAADLDGTTVAGSGLIVDKERVRLVATDATKKYVVDVSGEKPRLYDYTTSGFRWTSKTFVGRNLEPLGLTKLGFFVAHTNTSNATLTYQVKQETTWSTAESIDLPYVRGKYTRQEFTIRNPMACRRWAMRITAISSNLRIRAIHGYVKTGGIRGYSE